MACNPCSPLQPTVRGFPAGLQAGEVSLPRSLLLQLALRGSVKDEFISGRAVLGIEDISPFCRDMAGRAAAPGAAAAGWPDLLVPCERVLQLEAGLAAHIEADAWDGLLV